MKLRWNTMGFGRLLRLALLSVCLCCMLVAEFVSAQYSADEPTTEEKDDGLTYSENQEMNSLYDGDHEEYVQLETLDYEVPIPRKDFTLPGSSRKFSLLPDCTDEEPVNESSPSYVLVSTLNGDITSLDLATGAVLWQNSLGDQRLFSTSLSSPTASSTPSSSGLQLVSAGKAVELVPSLDGLLYQVSKVNNNLEAVPVFADHLQSSTFKFDDDTYVSGGYSSESYGLYASSGALLYKCDQDGCKKCSTTDGVSPTVSDSDDVLLVTKTIRNVYAFDPVLGVNKFNYSVGEHQLELVRNAGCRATTGRGTTIDSSLPVLRFSLADHLVQAELKDGSRLWSKRFDHAISGAWRLLDGELTKVDLLQPSNLYDLVPLHSSPPLTNHMASPDIYIGTVGNQKYVQHSQRLKRRMQAYSVANLLRRTNYFKIDGQVFERPSISWQPYLARPPTPHRALTDQNEGRPLAIEYHPNTIETKAADDRDPVNVFSNPGMYHEDTGALTGPASLPAEQDLLTKDTSGYNNVGVYLFLNDVFRDDIPTIEWSGNKSARLVGSRPLPIPGSERARPPTKGSWAWFCLFFDWTLNFSYKIRLSAITIQLVLLLLCLVLGVRVFSTMWSDWLLTLLLAPVLPICGFCARWWCRWRQTPRTPERERLPYTSKPDQHYHPTDYYSTNERSEQVVPFIQGSHQSTPNHHLRSLPTSDKSTDVGEVRPLDPSADHISYGKDEKLARFFSDDRDNNNSPLHSTMLNVEQSPSPHSDRVTGNQLSEHSSDSTKEAGTLIPTNTPSIQSTATPPTFANQQSVSSTDSRGDCGQTARSRLDEFEIRSVLGWGGFGVVFKAYVKLDDNEYALKRIPIPSKEGHKTRAYREVRLLARLNHKNIVRYNGCWTDTHSEEFIKDFDERWKRMVGDKLFSYQSPEAYTSPGNTNQAPPVEHSTAPSIEETPLPRGGNNPFNFPVGRSKNIPLENPLAMGRNIAPKAADINNAASSQAQNKASFSVNSDDDSYIQFRETTSSQSNFLNRDSKHFLNNDNPEETDSDEGSDDHSNRENSGGSDSDDNFENFSGELKHSDVKEDSFSIEFRDDSVSRVKSYSGRNLNIDMQINTDSNVSDLPNGFRASLNPDDYPSDSVAFEERSRRSSNMNDCNASAQPREEEERDSNVACSSGARPESLNLTSNVDAAENLKQPEKQPPKWPRDYLYIQMELCDTKTLKDWLQQNQERPKPKVLKFFLDIVSAVEHAHDMQMMHRDLKPSNIFFSLYHDEALKVGDWGLVTRIAEDDSILAEDACTPASPTTEHGPSAEALQKQHTAFAGTYNYMSPEQLRKEEYDYKVDIYSMGLILFEMLWAMHTDSERIRVLAQVRSLQFPNGFKEAHPEEHELLQLMLHADPQKRPTTRGIRARDPLRRMQTPYELETIKGSEHFQLFSKKHRRNTSSTSNHDVAEALAAAT